MNKLLNKYKSMINKNNELNDKVKEYIAIAILAIDLTFDEKITNRIPSILEKLNIYAEKKSVLDMSHEILENYSEDDKLKNSNAAVTRSLAIEDNTIIDEKWNMLISLLDKDSESEIITKTIHELIHLLRFNGIKQTDNKAKMLDGISTNYINTETFSVKRKHYNLEEGIVQYFTNLCIYTLCNYKNTGNDTLNNYIKTMKNKEIHDYYLQVTLINYLCQDKVFQNHLLNTFTEQVVPSKLATYYNDKLNDNCAFTRFSKNIDIILENINNEKTEEILKSIMNEIRLFLSKSSQIKIKLF